ncbi:hypothetical protein ACJMK2_015683 [Sinanodonta woodiana]|uniref:Uncharacterized protein n=1 Tax=Sinanodonta woodiana TaxID=1069815 RepID=A0ABD3UR57_SINWO
MKMKLPGIFSGVLLLIQLNMVVLAENIVVDMDLGDSCGEVYHMNSTRQIRITSKGRAHRGYCGVTLYAPHEVNSMCTGICVTFISSKMATCDVKVKFTAVVFSKDTEDHVMVYDCRHPDRGPWCWSSDSVRVEVIESFKYSQRWVSHLYSLDIVAKAQCDTGKPDKSNSRNELEENDRRILIEGLVVSVSLALIFLVILLVFWCYYKHQPVRSGLHSGPLFIKAPSFSGFRSKLNLSGCRRNQPSSSKSAKETYKKTESPKQMTKQKSSESIHSAKHDVEAPVASKPLASSTEFTSKPQASNTEVIVSATNEEDMQFETKPLIVEDLVNENAGENTVEDKEVIMGGDSMEVIPMVTVTSDT